MLKQKHKTTKAGFALMFSRLQMSFLIIMYTSISNHVFIIPHLLTIAKRDSWICILIAYFIFTLWGLILLFILRRLNRQKLFDWLTIRVGKAIATLVIFLFALFLFISGLVSFYDVIQVMNIYFVPQTSLWLISAVYLLLIIPSCIKSGVKTAVYLSALFLPIVWLLGMFVAVITIPDKSYGLLLPVFFNGYEPILKGTLLVLGGSVELIVILLLQHKLEKSFSVGQFLILITIIIWLTLGPTVGSLTSFGPNLASNLRFPAFEQWRLVTLGPKITHVDFLAVFQLLVGATIKIILCFSLFMEHLEINSNRVKKMTLGFIAIIYAVISSLPVSDIIMEQFITYNIYLNFILFGIVVFLFILILCFIPQNQEKGVNSN
ncbi:endospore germination permease [Alkalihalobacterium sp. APHAB7]|uniref:endospore germination permease n=1 Tax=Alkalihalobacterium sp. APHAB7 TaxID=3402081 RepID=UPI003AAE0C0E